MLTIFRLTNSFLGGGVVGVGGGVVGRVYGPNNNYKPMSQRRRNLVGAEMWKEKGEWARSNGTKEKGQELEMSKIT